ncbi:MAG: hypothetical protein NQU46_00075 [Methanolinea sp.]|nr:hypothetical protein [Methanolinea sp.]
MNGRDHTRTGEFLLQFLLADQVCSTRDPPLSPRFLQEFISPYGIRVGEIDIHVLEKNTFMQDKVTIGTFFLTFEREGDEPGRKVDAQGIFTVRDSGKETWIKFTSSAYSFKVHLRKGAIPLATLTGQDRVIQLGPPGPGRDLIHETQV